MRPILKICLCLIFKFFEEVLENHAQECCGYKLIADERYCALETRIDFESVL